MICHYAEPRVLFIVMLNVNMVSVVMLNVVMLSVVAPAKNMNIIRMRIRLFENSRDINFFTTFVQSTICPFAWVPFLKD